MSADNIPIEADVVVSECDSMRRGDSPYDRLRNAVLTGALKAGEAYSQVALIEKLGVSRTPLREAIRRLQSEGLLESQRGRRILVAPLDPADLRQLYAMRISQECLGVCLSVPKLSDEDLGQARLALDEHLAACGRRQLAEARGPHREFHRILFSRSGTRLSSSLAELWDHAERYRLLYFHDQDDQLGLLQLAASEHESIFSAASERDGELSGELIARHLARTALTVFARLASDTDPVDVRIALRLAIHGTNSAPKE